MTERKRLENVDSLVVRCNQKDARICFRIFALCGMYSGNQCSSCWRPLYIQFNIWTTWCFVSSVVFIVVVDSFIQRIVLATEKTMATQQVSHRPIKCQSRLWSQRGTKVNGSHHSANPLLRPTGIQIATNSYMRLYKQWHGPISKWFIEPPSFISRATSIDSDCCRLPTTSVLSNKADKLRSNQF